jgi:arylformamidase
MKIYLDYDQKELDRQYEHREWIDDADKYVEAQSADSKRVRDAARARGRFDVAYGPHEDELLDIYPADRVGPSPVVVFFHGGRWARGSKASNCEGAEIYTALGVHFVSVNFSLLPAVTMDVLIRQCRDAIAWIWRNADTFGGDRTRMFVHGKSSGAHVGAMMAITDWRAEYDLPGDLVKGALLVSGMYDLEPVRLTFRNDWLKLDAAGAARNSPIRHIPDHGCPLIVGMGALETDEFRRQPRAFAEAWRAKGLDCRLIEMPGRHHFTVNEEMKNPSSAIVAPFLGWMGLEAAAAE